MSGMPADNIRSFLKLQHEMFVIAWEDAQLKDNLYAIEMWTAWRYACKYRIEKLVAANASIEDVLLECMDQLEKTEELKLKLSKIGPRTGPNSDIEYLFLT
jgi:hypothetical protein